MKTAIYIEEGITQLVLTPDNEWEKSVLKTFAAGQENFRVIRNSFYRTRGGWVRHGESYEDQSVILVQGIQPSTET